MGVQLFLTVQHWILIYHRNRCLIVEIEEEKLGIGIVSCSFHEEHEEQRRSKKPLLFLEETILFDLKTSNCNAINRLVYWTSRLLRLHQLTAHRISRLICIKSGIEYFWVDCETRLITSVNCPLVTDDCCVQGCA